MFQNQIGHEPINLFLNNVMDVKAAFTICLYFDLGSDIELVMTKTGTRIAHGYNSVLQCLSTYYKHSQTLNSPLPWTLLLWQKTDWHLSSWPDFCQLFIKQTTLDNPQIRWIIPYLTVACYEAFSKTDVFNFTNAFHLNGPYLTSCYPWIWFCYSLHMLTFEMDNLDTHNQYTLQFMICNKLLEILKTSTNGFPFQNVKEFPLWLNCLATLLNKFKLPLRKRANNNECVGVNSICYSFLAIIEDKVVHAVSTSSATWPPHNGAIYFSNVFTSCIRIDTFGSCGSYWLYTTKTQQNSSLTYVNFCSTALSCPVGGSITPFCLMNDSFLTLVIPPPLSAPVNGCTINLLPTIFNMDSWSVDSDIPLNSKEIALYTSLSQFVRRVNNILTLEFNNGRFMSYQTKKKDLEKNLPSVNDHYIYESYQYHLAMGDAGLPFVSAALGAEDAYHRISQLVQTDLSPSVLTSQSGPITSAETSTLEYLSKSKALKPFQVVKNPFYNDQLQLEKNEEFRPGSPLFNTLDLSLLEYFAEEDMLPYLDEKSQETCPYKIAYSSQGVMDLSSYIEDGVLGNTINHIYNIIQKTTPQPNVRRVDLDVLRLDLAHSWLKHLGDQCKKLGVEQNSSISHPDLNLLSNAFTLFESGQDILFTQKVTHLYNSTREDKMWIDKGIGDGFEQIEVPRSVIQSHKDDHIRGCKYPAILVSIESLHSLGVETTQQAFVSKIPPIQILAQVGIPDITDLNHKNFIVMLIVYNIFLHPYARLHGSSLTIGKKQVKELRTALLFWKINVQALYETNRQVWTNGQLLGNVASFISALKPFHLRTYLFKSPNIPFLDGDIRKCFKNSSSSVDIDIICFCFLVKPLWELLPMDLLSVNSALLNTHSVIICVHSRNDIEIPLRESKKTLTLTDPSFPHKVTTYKLSHSIFKIILLSSIWVLVKQ